ncbi:reverse transcriptase [Daphnia sinensis]|uniref:Reverse transcriptase n=1 Tax=Daphnia sinensis TaxID=1820382 RepID=A0AAD5PZW2_9CRUS|nr:reverse transcriptase [Daphnia sinensis]
MDKLSFSWNGRNGYAFSPFALIKDCLSKVIREKATLILVCPCWPSQFWFPMLLDLASDTPMLLRTESDLLTSSRGQPHSLCESKTSQLIAWRLSGDGTAARAFRRRWASRQLCWPTHGGPPEMRTCPSGWLGAVVQ